MKLQIEYVSPPLIGLIFGMPVYVLMNMANIYFQPEEILRKINADAGNFTFLFLAGKLISLFFSVFVAAAVTVLTSNRQTLRPLIIIAIFTAVLSVIEALTNNYPIWFSVLAILCCIVSTVTSNHFIHKFSN